MAYDNNNAGWRNMKKLWQKDWTLNSDVEAFETQSDLEYDIYLLPFDVAASAAHAKMLRQISVLSAEESTKIQEGLKYILQKAAKNQFLLETGEEDIHTKIENFLTERFGDVGKKIHTGRSRNDQVLTALRLFSKQELLSIWEEVLKTAAAFLEFAQKYEFIPMPGYTHMQKAMPSSFGMWAGSFAEGLVDDLTPLFAAYNLTNQSPLGSGASYGVPLPLNREMTAELLGFAKVQSNSLYCQNSRGKIESITLAALCAVLCEVNKFATDVLLFTTEEFGIFQVDPTMYSGSSMMPQKKNVDIAELLRSKVHVVMGNYVQTLSVISNLPSGYNRDFQDTKKPFIESVLLTKHCLKMTQLLLSQLTPNSEKTATHLTPDIFTTHYAYQLLAKGIPFRDAYMQAADALKSGNMRIPADYLHMSQHVGGTGNLQLKQLEKMMKEEVMKQKVEAQYFTKCLANVLLA